MERDTFYVTTPIYYVTARPHLGSLYSTLLADILARWQRLRGKETFMLTGTDEHGQKVAQAAQEAGKHPKIFVDSFIDAYKRTWREYAIDYNRFIRTTDPNHVAAVQHWLRQMVAKDEIYKDAYTGWYCTPCETFVTEKDAGDVVLEGPPACPSCGRATHKISEECYFFRLSAYQDKLLAWYKEHPDFILPRERAHEVINFVKAGLKDLCISRTAIDWGIPFPGDKKHIAYVWADALNNYITAIGYAQKGKEQEFKKWWPADVHVLGKDIVRFHAIYWPAFLMATDLPLPHQLLVHGWIKINQQKMSKSLGNVVDPDVLQENYGADQVRFYLARHMAVNHDGDFSTADLERTITADLANSIGNLLNRTLTLAEQHGLREVASPPAWANAALELRDAGATMVEEFVAHMAELHIHLALASLMKFVAQVNAYFHAAQPWKIAKSDAKAFAEVIAATCESLRTVGLLLTPIMPTKMQELLGSIGVRLKEGHNTIGELEANVWNHTFVLKRGKPLFEKPEKTTESAAPATAQPPSSEQIKIDDFAKVELRVGTIQECEPVPKSDKLYKLQVNLGPLGMRQVLSGIQKYFAPDDLIGKQAVFVCNLKPRKMLGLESQGMLLVSEDADGKLQLITVGASVPDGERIR